MTRKMKRMRTNYDRGASKNYRCSACGATGVKLWRDAHTTADAVDLKCADCAGGWDLEKGDQTGGLVPAIPTPEGDTFWGYTSSPNAAVTWWWRLPPHAVHGPAAPEPPKYVPPDLTHEVEYLVEANSAETMWLWERYEGAVKWEQINPGFSATVGFAKNAKGKKMPVCVTVFYERIDGHLVGFYDATSVVVDHDAVEAWLTKTYPNSKGSVDALNFHNCISALGVSGFDSKRCAACGDRKLVRDKSTGRAA